MTTSKHQELHAELQRDPSPDETSVALRAVAAEPHLTAALQLAEQLRMIASRSTDPGQAAHQLAAVVRDGDDLSALAAVHALGSIAHAVADRVLLQLVENGDEPFAGHAAWALGARGSSPRAIAALVALVAGGGFTAMLAERTLVEWSRIDPAPVLAAAHHARGHDSAGRARVGELMRAVLGHADETPRRSFDHLTTITGRRESTIGTGHSLDLRQHDRPLRAGDGIVVIQPFLHAHLDRAGSALGAGDAGGIASLLRSLGTALADVDGIDEVITITRRHGRRRATGRTAADDSEPFSEQLAPGHRVERIDVGPPGPLPWREGWAHRTEIERDFTAIGRALAGRRVVWHLRMADVGTLAAAAAARRLGQPVVFTAAPDPHIVIDAMQDSGRLDRARFALEDAANQFWFRARMVERLTAQADRLTLLPRPTIVRELVELLGVDEIDLSERATVVPEGVDVVEIDRARARSMMAGVPVGIDALLATIPTARRHLPWVLSVGRLHPSKGPHRIVEAVVGDPGLSALVNVIIAGGDIEHPSPDEQSTIELIRRAAEAAAPGTVTLTGHLPPAAIADLMVHTVARHGMYVCASDKEEFGLAIVEALAAGAVVVAPERGGPRTYVHGDLGVLCDTMSVPALRIAMVEAMQLVDEPGRARRARTMVRDHLSVEHMAERLGQVYRELVPSPVPS